MPRAHSYRCFLPDLAEFTTNPVTRTRPSTTISSLDSESYFVASRNVAEREGFEPSVACATHDFQSCTFGHSVTSPEHVASLVSMCRLHELGPDEMAERGGFEPPVRNDRTTDFESAAFVHSATSPDLFTSSLIPTREWHLTTARPPELWLLCVRLSFCGGCRERSCEGARCTLVQGHQA